VDDGRAWLGRLERLGLALPPVPQALAAYVPAVRDGGVIWVSGQLPISDGRIAICGRLGADLGVAEGQAAARLCVLGALAAAAALAPEGLSGPLRVEGYVQCTPEFQDQPAVLNGASELLGLLFPGRGHARLAVGCAALPRDAAVEVACVFRVAAPS